MTARVQDTRLLAPRAAVAALFFHLGALFGSWVSRIPSFKAELALTERDLGLILLGMAIGAMTSFTFSGWLADTQGASRVGRWGAVANGLAVTVVAFAGEPWMLAFGLFLMGLTGAALDISMNAWGGEVERAAGRPLMSGFHAMWSVGTAVGAACGGLAVHLGLPPSLHMTGFAALSTLFAFVLASAPWDSAGGREREKRPFLMLPPARLAPVGIIVVCAYVCEGAAADWAALLLMEVANASEAAASQAFTVFSVAMIAMRLAGDRLTARFGAPAVARASGSIAALGVLLAVSGISIWTGYAGIGLLAAGAALLVPLSFSRAAAENPGTAGAAIAGMATFGYAGMLLGPVAIGFVAHEFSLRLSFAMLAGLAVLAALLAGALKRPAN